MKKISIITITFNDVAGLKKTVQSVCNQSVKDFEFLVIDGGSTDGSKEFIAQNQDNIDFWVSEKDNGVYNAMNKGIKAAKGDFVIFMNSGDIFHDNFVIESVQPHLTADFDIYYGDNYKVKKDSKRKKTYPEKLAFSFFYTSSINHQSTFIRRQLFSDHFFYNENYKIVSDWEFFIYTICKVNVPYKYLPITICDYDFTGISSLDQYRHVSSQEKQETIKRFFPLFEEDYKQVAELNSKRVQQVLHLQKTKWPWKILKTVISVLLVFAPKMRTQ